MFHLAKTLNFRRGFAGGARLGPARVAPLIVRGVAKPLWTAAADATHRKTGDKVGSTDEVRGGGQGRQGQRCKSQGARARTLDRRHETRACLRTLVVGKSTYNLAGGRVCTWGCRLPRMGLALRGHVRYATAVS